MILLHAVKTLKCRFLSSLLWDFLVEGVGEECIKKTIEEMSICC